MERDGGTLLYKVVGKPSLKRRYFSRHLKEVSVELFQEEVTEVNTIIRPILEKRSPDPQRVAQTVKFTKYFICSPTFPFLLSVKQHNDETGKSL